MNGLRVRLTGTLGRWVLNALMATVRFRVERADRLDRLDRAGEPVLYTLWHGRLLPLTYVHRHRGIGALISQSRDGEYIARVVEGWGYEPIRGSTSRRGGQALREIVKRVRGRGQSIAFTPDGPRGPRQKLQPGVITAAQLSGGVILPVTAGASRAWWVGGWDRFCIPKPFAVVHVVYGEPRRVPRDAGEAELSRHAQELEAELNVLTREVDGDGGPDA